MLAHPDFNCNTIDTYKQKIFQKFMLGDCVYKTPSLN